MSDCRGCGNDGRCRRDNCRRCCYCERVLVVESVVTTQRNPDECARLIAEAYHLIAEGQTTTGGDWSLVAMQHLRAMADQLEAAQAEIERLSYQLADASGTTMRQLQILDEASATIRHITAERDQLRRQLEASAAKIARLEQQHDGMCKIVEATTGTIDKLNATRAELESARKDAEHWREARRVALEGGEILKAELEAMRREVAEMRPVVEAACGYRDDGPVGAGILAAVDAYRAARGPVQCQGAVRWQHSNVQCHACGKFGQSCDRTSAARDKAGDR